MSVYDRIVGRAMSQFSLGQKAFGMRRGDKKKVEVMFKPHITVSRDPGSGGRPIAKMVSRKLGFEFYNKKLLREIARSAKKRKEVVMAVDEKGRGAMSDFVHNIFNPEYVDDLTYMNHLCRVILSLAYKGKAVILGRGGNFITPGTRGLHIRITAPYDVRVQRSIQYEEVSRDRAKEIIKRVDKDRKDFVSQYFSKNITNPDYYDFVLNTEFMSLEEARDIIICAFKQKFPKF